MNRRECWQPVLDSELAKWSAKSYEQLRVELANLQVYEVGVESVAHQIEVELLRDAGDHVEILVSVDDGSLPASLKPAIGRFSSAKPPSS
jgi:hypothetical protein